MERKDELTILGKKTEYKQDYAPDRQYQNFSCNYR